MTDEEKMALLKRHIEDPLLASDNGTLRLAIASIFGWEVRPYPKGREPWNLRLVRKPKGK